MYKILFIIFILLLLIDLPMILFLNKNMYSKQFMRINNEELKLNTRALISGIICYCLITFAIYYFGVKSKNILNGFLIGLVIYGVYNTTNLATITNFGIIESIVDTMWGTIVCGVITSIVLYNTNTNYDFSSIHPASI